jgi:hypothetical protein
MNRMLPEGLQEKFFRLISGGFSLVLATRDEEDPGKLGERIGATVRKHNTGLPMEAEIDCVTGMKETRTVILTQYAALRGALRKASMILSILDTQHRSSWEVKNRFLAAPVDFVLTSHFMCAKSKTTSLAAPLGFILNSLFHVYMTL